MVDEVIAGVSWRCVFMIYFGTKMGKSYVMELSTESPLDREVREYLY